jgi:vancomycin resistance protein YoaR
MRVKDISKRDFKKNKPAAKKKKYIKMTKLDVIKKRNLIVIFSCVFVFIILGILLVVFTQIKPSKEDLIVYQKNGIFGTHTIIEGVDVTGKTIDEARISLKDSVDNKLISVNITYSVKGKVYNEDAFSLGLKTDINDILIEAMLFEKTGSLWQRLLKAKEAEKYKIYYQINIVADKSTVTTAVKKIVSDYNVNPVEPKITFNPNAETEEEYIVWSEEVAGIKVDADSFINKILHQIPQDQYNFGELEYIEIKPKQTKEDVASSIVKLSEFSTSYAKGSLSEENRVYNISYMAEKLSGSIINVGEKWSINETVGERTEKNGWKVAPAIRNGVLIDELGGGVCQVSSTVYNAFLLAEVAIVERHAHSYPSPYIATGLDATIDYGNKDLEVKNTLSDTVYIVVMSDKEEKTVSAMAFGPKPDHDYQVVMRGLIWEDAIKPTEEKKYKVAKDGFAPDGVYVNVGTSYAYPATLDGSRWKTYRYYYPKDYNIDEDSPYSWIGYIKGDNNSGEKHDVKFSRADGEDKSIVSFYPPQSGLYYLNPNDPRSFGLDGSVYN